jgi:hypothetical protein
MNMMDFSTLSHLKKNQEIEVTAANGKFYGKFYKISSGKRLELADVQDQNGNSLGNFKYFFVNSVIDVKVVNENCGDSINTFSSSLSSGSSSSLQLFSSQVEHISNTIHNCSYIQHADEKYFKAVAEISKELVIGIFAEGAQRGR